MVFQNLLAILCRNYDAVNELPPIEFKRLTEVSKDAFAKMAAITARGRKPYVKGRELLIGIPKKVQESGKIFFFTTREQGSLESAEPTERRG